MKKTMIVLLVLLCLLASACGNAGSDIELYEDEVSWEELLDGDGNLLGYVKETGGINCGAEGIVLSEVYDREKNLLQSFSPKLPGCTLEVFMSEGWLEVYEWNEASDNNGFGCYYVRSFALDRPYAYVENRDGATTRLELYGPDGQVVKTLTPSVPDRELEVVSESNETYFCVVEFMNSPTRIDCTRSAYYNRDGELLGDFWYTSDEEGRITRLEARDEAGNVLYAHNATTEDCFLHASYVWELEQFVVCEEYEFIDTETGLVDWATVYEEWREAKTQECIYSVENREILDP